MDNEIIAFLRRRLDAIKLESAKIQELLDFYTTVKTAEPPPPLGNTMSSGLFAIGGKGESRPQEASLSAAIRKAVGSFSAEFTRKDVERALRGMDWNNFKPKTVGVVMSQLVKKGTVKIRVPARKGKTMNKYEYVGNG